MKIVFLDAATMGDVSFEPIARLGDFTRYDNSTPEQARERVRDVNVLIIKSSIFSLRKYYLHSIALSEISEGTVSPIAATASEFT